MDSAEELRKLMLKAEELSDDLQTSVQHLESLIDNAKAEEYAKGVRDGARATAHNFSGQVVVLKVDDPESLSHRQMQFLSQMFIKELNAKLVIIREDADLATLDWTHLKALGLQKIPSGT